MKYSLLFMWLFIYYPWFRGKGGLREEQSFFHPKPLFLGNLKPEWLLQRVSHVQAVSQLNPIIK